MKEALATRIRVQSEAMYVPLLLEAKQYLTPNALQVVPSVILESTPSAGPEQSASVSVVQMLQRRGT